MTLANPSDWIVVDLPPGVDRAAIERLAAQNRGVIRDEIPENYVGQYIVVVDLGKHELPFNARVVDPVRLRGEFFVGATLEECISGLREGAKSSRRWDRRCKVRLVLDGCSETDLEALIAETQSAFALVPAAERELPQSWLANAVNGDITAAVNALNWLSADPSRLPALRIVSATASSELTEPRTQFVARRSVEMLTLRGELPFIRRVISGLGEGCTGLLLHCVSDDGTLMEALVRGPAWDGFRQLSLSRSLENNKGFELSFSTPKSVPLRQLNLSEGELNPSQLERLVGSSILRGVQEFNVASNDGRARLAELVATSDSFRDIEHLDLSRNGVGDAGLDAIGKYANWPKLHTLNVRGEFRRPLLSDAGILSLIQNKSFSSLRSLDLSQNHLSDLGFAALMQAESLPALEEINVQFCKITSGAAELLAGNRTLLRPKVLKISNNAIGNGKPGVSPKAASTRSYDGGIWKYAYWLSRLRDLKLQRCQLETDDLGNIAHSETLPHVTNLLLNHNESLGNEAIHVLAHSPLGARLKTLSIACVGVSDGIAEIIKSSPMGDGLNELAMSKSGQSEDEVQRLQQAFGARLRLT